MSELLDIFAGRRSQDAGATTVSDPSTGGARPVVFHGRDRADVKRAALAWWSRHGRAAGLSLREFQARCRLGPDQRTIVFQPAPDRPGDRRRGGWPLRPR